MTADIEAMFAAQIGAGARVGTDGQAPDLAALLGQVRPRELTPQDVWIASIPAHAIPITAGAGTLDLPDELGPQDGKAWAVHWITAASFTAGTVSAYIGQPADANLRFVFTSAGVWEPPRTSTILQPGDRLVFVAAGITGQVTISGQVTQMDVAMLPRFLI